MFYTPAHLSGHISSPQGHVGPTVAILEFLSAGCPSQLCHILPMWPWASHFTFLDFGFVICKMGVLTLSPSCGIRGRWWEFKTPLPTFPQAWEKIQWVVNHKAFVTFSHSRWSLPYRRLVITQYKAVRKKGLRSQTSLAVTKAWKTGFTCLGFLIFII